MSITGIIGIILLLGIFAGLFIFTATVVGFWMSLAVWGIATVIALMITLAMFLIERG